MNLTELIRLINYRLAQIYPELADARRIVTIAGFPAHMIDISGKPINMWFNILYYLSSRGGNKSITKLLQVILDSDELGDQDELLLGFLMALKEDIIPVKEPRSNWKSITVKNGTLEKLMERKSTLLPISFLERGLLCAKCVVRILTPGGVATGFVIENNILVTNNHVLNSYEDAIRSKIQFNYQSTLEGDDLFPETISLHQTKATNFFTNEELDFTFIKLTTDINAVYGSLVFAETLVEVNDNANIIQHPGGSLKQIALYHNLVTDVDNLFVQYLTDTLPGSSGSPVFNNKWEVVAVHRKGGNIPSLSSDQFVFRNEGVNIIEIKKALVEFNGASLDA